MKRKAAGLLCGIMLLAVSLAGCGSAGKPASHQVSNTEAASQGEKETETKADDKKDVPKSGTEKQKMNESTFVGANAADSKSDGKGTKEEPQKPGNVPDSNGAAPASDNGEQSASDSKKPSGGASCSPNRENPSAGGSGSTENQKPSGGGSTDTQKPSGGGNGGSTAQPETPSQPEQPSQPQQPEHTHSWVEETTTVTHEATGHYEDRVVKEAWEEPVYEYRLVCNKCGTVFTNEREEPADDIDLHYAFECSGSYSSKKIQTDTIHHEAEIEQVWVEDSPAYTETVGTGKYTCSTCGATK